MRVEGTVVEFLDNGKTVNGWVVGYSFDHLMTEFSQRNFMFLVMTREGKFHQPRAIDCKVIQTEPT